MHKQANQACKEPHNQDGGRYLPQHGKSPTLAAASLQLYRDSIETGGWSVPPPHGSRSSTREQRI
jgi:hypothetical protein